MGRKAQSTEWRVELAYRVLSWRQTLGPITCMPTVIPAEV